MYINGRHSVKHACSWKGYRSANYHDKREMIDGRYLWDWFSHAVTCGDSQRFPHLCRPYFNAQHVYVCPCRFACDRADRRGVHVYVCPLGFLESGERSFSTGEEMYLHFISTAVNSALLIDASLRPPDFFTSTLACVRLSMQICMWSSRQARSACTPTGTRASAALSVAISPKVRNVHHNMIYSQTMNWLSFLWFLGAKYTSQYDLLRSNELGLVLVNTSLGARK